MSLDNPTTTSVISYLGVTTKNSLPSETFETDGLDGGQYDESNGGNRFSIGQSMTKLCVKIFIIMVQCTRDYFPRMWS